MAANGRTSEPTKSIFFFSGAAFFDFLTSLVISLLIIAATCSTLSLVSFTSAFLRPLLAGSFTSVLEAVLAVFLVFLRALTSVPLSSFFDSFFSLSSAFLRPLLPGLAASSAFLRPLLAGVAVSSAFLRPLLAGVAVSSAFLRPLFTGLTSSKALLSFTSEALTSATGLASFTGAFVSTTFSSAFFSGNTITSDFSLTASFTAASATFLSASLFLSFFPAILTSLYIWLQSPRENLSDSLSYLEYGVLINKERMSLAAA